LGIALPVAPIAQIGAVGCKAAGVNFRDWMVFFLENVHSYDNDYTKDLAKLLPHNFKSRIPENS
jgi:hypothetical protein